VIVRFRPLPTWPHPVTKGRRSSTFRVDWTRTLNELEYEIDRLSGRDVIIGAGLSERDIRIDGWPKSNASWLHPGIELSFDSRYGRLIYATDVFYDWRDNLRAIALGLAALRAVDRYGITRRGEQYSGWKALPTGSGDPATAEEAWGVLLNAAGIRPDGPNAQAARSNGFASVYRQAVKRAHPDTGGQPEVFRRVEAARKLLESVA
jgi:hypothetical protein